MPVAICGVARSGSTLAWQLLSSCLKDPVEQFHPYPATDLTCNRYVVTIRHPFDVIASRYRVRLSRGLCCQGIVGLEAELSVMLDHFAGARNVLNTRNAVLLRYEDFYDNYDKAFDLFEKFFEIEITTSHREILKEKYSLTSNMERAAKMMSFNEFDYSSHVHGDHIGAVTPGAWRSQLESWGIALVRGTCTELVKEWGYEVD